MGASPNWIRSDELIIYSGFAGENRNELQSRQCDPPGRILEAQSPAERLAASASATASAITNSSSSAQAAFTGGLSRQGLPEVPLNSKIDPQTPSWTEIEILINHLKVTVNERYLGLARTVYLVISLPKILHIHRTYRVLVNPKYICSKRCMTVYLVISLPKILYIHRIYRVLANPKYICSERCRAVYMVISLPKILYIHRLYRVLAYPKYNCSERHSQKCPHLVFTCTRSLRHCSGTTDGGSIFTVSHTLASA